MLVPKLVMRLEYCRARRLDADTSGAWVAFEVSQWLVSANHDIATSFDSIEETKSEYI